MVPILPSSAGGPVGPGDTPRPAPGAAGAAPPLLCDLAALTFFAGAAVASSARLDSSRGMASSAAESKLAPRERPAPFDAAGGRLPSATTALGGRGGFAGPFARGGLCGAVLASLVCGAGGGGGGGALRTGLAGSGAAPTAPACGAAVAAGASAAAFFTRGALLPLGRFENPQSISTTENVTATKLRMSHGHRIFPEASARTPCIGPLYHTE